MAIAVGLFGTAVLTERRVAVLDDLGHPSSSSRTVLVTVASGSFGQLLCRIAVVRLDTEPPGLARAALRAALVSLALPALIVGPHRRGLQDLAANTVVVNRK